MTGEEVFAHMKAHALEGMVFHDEMARYFDFLNLCGYRDCHRRHYEDETAGYRELCEYYMNHYNKLLPHTHMERPDVIPESWYGHKRQDVDKGTKQSAVKSAIKKWVEWETKTKELYEEMWLELMNGEEVAAAHFIAGFVRDVDNELKEAEKIHITLETAGYDIGFILANQ